jgi:hypothetical protein
MEQSGTQHSTAQHSSGQVYTLLKPVGSAVELEFQRQRRFRVFAWVLSFAAPRWWGCSGAYARPISGEEGRERGEAVLYLNV